MKAAGVLAIGVAVALFICAAYTFYQWNLTLDQSAIAEQHESPPSIPWQAQAGGEAIVGFVFLIPGIVMVSRNSAN